MKTKFINLINPRFFSDNFDPAGSYTGNYSDYDNDYDYEPDQDADDL